MAKLPPDRVLRNSTRNKGEASRRKKIKTSTACSAVWMDTSQIISTRGASGAGTVKVSDSYLASECKDRYVTYVQLASLGRMRKQSRARSNALRLITSMEMKHMGPFLRS